MVLSPNNIENSHCLTRHIRPTSANLHIHTAPPSFLSQRPQGRLGSVSGPPIKRRKASTWATTALSVVATQNSALITNSDSLISALAIKGLH